MNNVIVGMGEALWDILPEGKKIGGAPANFAYHIAQLGLDGRVVSAIGNDKLGTEILENFNEKKLNYLIEKVPYPEPSSWNSIMQEYLIIISKKTWPGTISPIPLLWKNWPNIPKRSASVPWPNATLFPAKPSIAFSMQCPITKDN